MSDIKIIKGYTKWKSEGPFLPSVHFIPTDDDQTTHCASIRCNCKPYYSRIYRGNVHNKTRKIHSNELLKDPETGFTADDEEVVQVKEEIRKNHTTQTDFVKIEFDVALDEPENRPCVDADKVVEILKTLKDYGLIEDELLSVSDTQEGGTHYLDMEIQPWDVIDKNFPLEQQIGFYRGNCLKYTMRLGTKDEMLKEAMKLSHYAKKLVEVLENRDD